MDYSILLHPAVFGLILFIFAVNSLIPAFVLKWIMMTKFTTHVPFLLVVLVLIVHNLLIAAILIWLGLLEPEMRGQVGVVPSLLLFLASQLILLIMLTLFVPDEEAHLIPVWQWLTVIALQWVVYWVFVGFLVLAIVAFRLLFAGPA